MITVGIDEVGRGCWAGPLVAAAVSLHTPITGLRDSKKLSAAQRHSLSDTILLQAHSWGLGWVAPREVDRLGLTAAVRLAMRRALQQCALAADDIIIDGNYNYLADIPGTRTIIRADDSVPAVSAASIIAKVARDTHMVQQALQYPGYGFEKHVGYGTAQHRAGLRQLGVCKIHRTSYKPIRAILDA